MAAVPYGRRKLKPPKEEDLEPIPVIGVKNVEAPERKQEDLTVSSPQVLDERKPTRVIVAGRQEAKDDLEVVKPVASQYQKPQIIYGAKDYALEDVGRPPSAEPSQFKVKDEVTVEDGMSWREAYKPKRKAVD